MLIYPTGPLFPAGMPSHMEWQRSWPTSSDHWKVSPPTISGIPNTLYNISNPSTYSKGNAWSPSMLRPFSPQYQWIMPYPLSKTNYNRTPISPKDLYIPQTHCNIAGVLPQNTYFLFEVKYFCAGPWCSHGFPH